MDVKKAFEHLIEDTLENIGGTLAASKEELAEYAAKRSIALATMLENDEPGFNEGLTAARNNLAMMAGLKAGAAARHTDDLWTGIFAGALRFAALALAGYPAAAMVVGAAAEVLTNDPAINGNESSVSKVNGGDPTA